MDIVIIVMILVIAAAIKLNYRNRQDRKLLHFNKIVYNYRAKSQKHVYQILSKYVDQLLKRNPDYKVDSFSKPIFKMDGTAIYVIYLKRKK